MNPTFKKSELALQNWRIIYTISPSLIHVYWTPLYLNVSKSSLKSFTIKKGYVKKLNGSW